MAQSAGVLLSFLGARLTIVRVIPSVNVALWRLNRVLRGNQVGRGVLTEWVLFRNTGCCKAVQIQKTGRLQISAHI